MPTYGYRCANCKNEFETFQKMSDAPLTTCEKCGGTLKKILYPVGIAFKGEGFYVNDSVKSAAPSAKKAMEGGESAASPEKAAADSGGEAAKTEKSEKSEKSDATPAAATPSANAAP